MTWNKSFSLTCNNMMPWQCNVREEWMKGDTIGPAILFEPVPCLTEGLTKEASIMIGLLIKHYTFHRVWLKTQNPAHTMLLFTFSRVSLTFACFLATLLWNSEKKNGKLQVHIILHTMVKSQRCDIQLWNFKLWIEHQTHWHDFWCITYCVLTERLSVQVTVQFNINKRTHAHWLPH